MPRQSRECQLLPERPIFCHGCRTCLREACRCQAGWASPCPMAQMILARLGHDLTPFARMDHLTMHCDCRTDAAADAACCCLLMVLLAAAAAACCCLLLLLLLMLAAACCCCVADLLLLACCCLLAAACCCLLLLLLLLLADLSKFTQNQHERTNSESCHLDLVNVSEDTPSKHRPVNGTGMAQKWH